MAKKSKVKIVRPDTKDWDKLGTLIKNYVDAAIADSWKGGGDPNDIPILELEEQLARAKLAAYINMMRRERGE